MEPWNQWNLMAEFHVTVAPTVAANIETERANSLKLQALSAANCFFLKIYLTRSVLYPLS